MTQWMVCSWLLMTHNKQDSFFWDFFKRQGHIEKILLVTFVPHVSVREAGDLWRHSHLLNTSHTVFVVNWYLCTSLCICHFFSSCVCISTSGESLLWFMCCGKRRVCCQLWDQSTPWESHRFELSANYSLDGNPAFHHSDQLEHHRVRVRHEWKCLSCQRVLIHHLWFTVVWSK